MGHGIRLHQLQQIFIIKSGIMTFKNSKMGTSRKQAWNLLLKKVIPSVRLKADVLVDTSRNTRCVTTQLTHTASQYHRCITLRNTTVFLLSIVKPTRCTSVSNLFYLQ
jgi:hypothetical protein